MTSDPNSWTALHGWLGNIAPIRHLNFVDVLPATVRQHCITAQGCETQLLKLDSRYAAEIEKAVRDLTGSGGDLAIINLSPVPKKLFAMRVDIARDWVAPLTNTENEGASNVIPFPQGNFTSTVHWLLIDFWRAQGWTNATLKMFPFWSSPDMENQAASD